MKIKVKSIIFIMFLFSLRPYECVMCLAGVSYSPDSQFEIATVEQLISVRFKPNAHCVLMNDIDLDPNLPNGRIFSQAVIASGSSYELGFKGIPFIGIFNGNGYKIKNLTIRSNSSDYLGLFGCIGYNGRVENLGFENATILGVDGTQNIGVLVGKINGGTINNCYAKGKISVGKNCVDVGGLMGLSQNSSITNCYSTVSVSADANSMHLGGLVGLALISKISNCYATGSVSGGIKSNGLGGLAGYSGSTISNCYSTSEIYSDKDTQKIGSLIGSDWGHVINCYFLAATNSNNYNNSIGLPLSDQQMKQQASFVNWDFEKIWSIKEDSDYPRLRPNLPEPPKPLPPDLSSCTRIEIQYYPSTLEYIHLSPVEVNNILSNDEKQYLESLKTIVVDDPDKIKSLLKESK